MGGLIGAAARGTGLSSGALVWLVAKAVIFLFGALWLGTVISPRLFGLTARLRGTSLLLVTALVFCFLMAAGAAAIGLAPIVGAYAAGLVLERVHYRKFTDRGEHQLEELIKPVSGFLVAIFFVLMGLKVDAERLRFAPCLPADWETFKLHYRYRETVYHISVFQMHVADDEIHVTMDGVEQQDDFIPLVDDRKEHAVVVRIHRAQTGSKLALEAVVHI